MATYNLVVHIDQAWIAQFNNDGIKLCFASAVESGKVNYNVIAYTSTVAGAVTITWTDEFYIAASRDSFSHGEQFTTATTIQPIQFGQTYLLPATWVDTKPTNDPRAPTDGFRFRNETIASAVLYKEVNGRVAPIYMSEAGPLPPGHEDLTPKPMCAVWFSTENQTQQMVSGYDSNSMFVDLTGKTTAAIQYDAQGNWLNV